MLDWMMRKTCCIFGHNWHSWCNFFKDGTIGAVNGVCLRCGKIFTVDAWEEATKEMGKRI